MKIKFISLVFFTTIFFCSCSALTFNKNSSVESDSPKFQVENEYFQVSVNKGIVSEIKDNNIIYFSFNSDNSVEYYKYDISTNNTVSLGKVHNFLMDNSSFALINDNLYHYITIQETENNNYLNKLFKIDLINDKMTEISSENLAHTLITVKEIDNKLISLKSKKSESIIKTYIEEYNPLLNSKKVLNEKSMDFDNELGELILDIASYNQEIYTITKKTDKDKLNYFLCIYDSNGNYSSEININGLKNIVDNEMIDELKIMGNYIYVRNFSGASGIYYIDFDKKKLDEVIYSDNRLDIALSNHTDEKLDKYIFYLRDTNEIFLFDIINKKFTKFNVSIDNKYQNLGSIVADNKYNIAVTLKSKDNPENQTIYYFNILNHIEDISSDIFESDNLIYIK